MNNEIKEMNLSEMLFNRDERLLDYIINLQQQLHQASLDIQELTERDIGCPSWCDKLTNLQQENERLKRDVELFKKDLISCTNTGLSLITKIDKTIEKLGNYKHYSTPTEEQNSENEEIVDSALNILQNGSEKDG